LLKQLAAELNNSNMAEAGFSKFVLYVNRIETTTIKVDVYYSTALTTTKYVGQNVGIA